MNIHGFHFASCCILSALGSVTPTMAQVTMARAETPPTNANAQSAKLTDEERKARTLQSWQDFLSGIAKQENANLFFDIDRTNPPPPIKYREKMGQAGMIMLAGLSNRSWQQINGVQTFTRSLDTARPQFMYADMQDALSWIDRLDSGTLSLLIHSGLGAEQLDDSGQAMVMRLAAWDPATCATFVDPGAAVNVGIQLQPAFLYTDPSSGQVKRINATCGPMKLSPPRVPANSTAASKKVCFRVISLKRPDGGGLNFGSGKADTLINIVNRGVDAFGVQYFVDGRIANNYYFVSGMYSRESFENALKAITPVAAVTPITRPGAGKLTSAEFLRRESSIRKLLSGTMVDFASARNLLPISGSSDLAAMNARYGATENLPMDAFLAGNTVSVSSLIADHPGLAGILSQAGVPADAVVTLQANLAVVISTDGTHPIGQLETNGVVTPLFQSNYLAAIL